MGRGSPTLRTATAQRGAEKGEGNDRGGGPVMNILYLCLRSHVWLLSSDKALETSVTTVGIIYFSWIHPRSNLIWDFPGRWRERLCKELVFVRGGFSVCMGTSTRALFRFLRAEPRNTFACWWGTSRALMHVRVEDEARVSGRDITNLFSALSGQ